MRSKIKFFISFAIFTTLLILGIREILSTEPNKIESFDKSITKVCQVKNCFELLISREKNLYYQINTSGLKIQASKLGLITSEGDFSKVKEVLKVEELPQSKNNVLVTFKNLEGKIWKLEIHQSKNGFAFRYQLPSKKPLTVSEELTEFKFTIDDKQRAYLQKYQKASLVSPSYEGWYEKMSLGTKDYDYSTWFLKLLNPIAEKFSWNFHGSDGYAFPALFRSNEEYLLITESDLHKEYPASHLHSLGKNSEAPVYQIAFPEAAQAEGDGETGAQMTTVFHTPWRVFIFGSAADIFSSTLVTDLVKEEMKTPWAKPGKATWNWWAYQKTGDPERQKAYIKAAADFGWDYTLIDANWNKWPNAYKRVQELADHARELKIDLLLWYNSGGTNNRIPEEPRGFMHERNVRRMEMARISQMGIKGIKIDFFHSDKQKHIKQMIEILEDAYDYKLMVNFHGATIPRGLRKRFPHLMTIEAVKGAEWYQFPIFRGPSALDHLRYVFTRNIVGPMDYTPLVFDLPYKQQKITYAHSLALSVVFESPLQHFADIADQEDAGYRKLFKDYPEVKNFLRYLPTTWDASKLVTGSPDDYIIIARRKGKIWYLSGINALNKAVTINLNLQDFCQPTCSWQIITDKLSGKGFNIKEIEKAKQIFLTMQAKGGFVIWNHLLHPTY